MAENRRGPIPPRQPEAQARASGPRAGRVIESSPHTDFQLGRPGKSQVLQRDVRAIRIVEFDDKTFRFPNKGTPTHVLIGIL